MGDDERVRVRVPGASGAPAYNPMLGALGADGQPRNLVPETWSNKSWSQQMVYHTGVAYGSGIVLGGTYGFVEGMRKSHGLVRALKANQVLNTVSRRGSGTANAFGMLAMMYTSYDSLLAQNSYRKETWHSVAAAGLTGLTYKCTDGILRAGVAGAVAAGLAGAVHLAQDFLAEE